MSYTHLSLQEHKGIFYQREMGISFRAIATFFGRSHSTIIRGHHRNKNPYKITTIIMKLPTIAMCKKGKSQNIIASGITGL